MPRVTVQALAKVNLGLRILGRRPDQYHELRTVFQTISLADRIEVECRRATASRVALTCSRAELAGPGNLAARAAKRLLAATGRRARVRIHLEKRIPVGAGLGGGSSDAGAVLLALWFLLRPRPDWELLWRVAAGLGSDVPFFLLGGRALGLGRGEEIYPLADGPARWMLVIAPPIPISTAEAYRRWSADLTRGRREDKIGGFWSTVCASEPEFEGGEFQERSGALGNDFERVVFQSHPSLRKIKARLERLGARPALLCGSGSALFGVFANRREAIRARHSLADEPGQCFVVHTVQRSRYRALWRQWLKAKRRK